MKNLFNKSIDVYHNTCDVYSPVVAFFAVAGAILFGLGIGFGISCLYAWIIMLLWNWIAVSLFGAPVLTFWVAFGLRLLVVFLFKGLSFGSNKTSKE